MSERPALRVIDAETGEIRDTCPSCAELREQLAGAERDIRAWRTRCARLERDVEREARQHPSWDDAQTIFDYWRLKCRHPKAGFSADRFRLVEPFIRKDGPRACCIAILGAAYDPFIATRRNGSKKRFDDWELIFRDRGKFEEFVERAPGDLAR